jgi:hypothetical protein
MKFCKIIKAAQLKLQSLLPGIKILDHQGNTKTKKKLISTSIINEIDEMKNLPQHLHGMKTNILHYSTNHWCRKTLNAGRNYG